MKTRHQLILKDVKRQEYEPKWKEKRFKTEKGFDAWLKRTAKYVIDFKDKGQDCLQWHLSEGGEVIHANLQSSIWSGQMVDLSWLKAGRCVRVLLDGSKDCVRAYDFVIEKITINDHARK